MNPPWVRSRASSVRDVAERAARMRGARHAPCVSRGPGSERGKARSSLRTATQGTTRTSGAWGRDHVLALALGLETSHPDQEPEPLPYVQVAVQDGGRDEDGHPGQRDVFGRGCLSGGRGARDLRAQRRKAFGERFEQSLG